MKNTTYNGWKNYETWNVALWISNDEYYYNIARGCSDYNDFVSQMHTIFGIMKTPDCVSWDDCALDYEALDNFIEEL